MKKINYPSVRKKPFRHKVKTHKREGHSINSYERGAGKESRKAQSRTNSITTRRRVNKVKKSGGAEGFTFTFKYKDGSSEKIHIIAGKKGGVTDYKSAVDEALEERTHKEMPIAMDIVDPSIKQTMKFIGKSVGSGMKWTARGAKRAGKIGIKVGKLGVKLGRQTAEFGAETVSGAIGLGGRVAGEMGSTFVTGIQERDARRLVNDAYSNDKVTRMFARKTLQRRYPELYDNMSFSPAKFKTPLEKLASGQVPKVSKTESQARKILKSISRKIQGKERLKAGLAKIQKVQNNPRASRQTLLNANAVSDFLQTRIQGFMNPDLGPSEQESVKKQMYKNFDMGRTGVEEVASLDEAHSKAESEMRSQGYVIDKDDVIHFISTRYSMKKQRTTEDALV